ncbi:MAG: hypothetical protein ABI193_04360 [Minicystis sp.]
MREAPRPAYAAPAATPLTSAPFPAPSAPAARYAPPTLASAGARTCTLESPVEIAAIDGDPTALFEVQTSIAFGRSGGLFVWQGRDEDTQAWARPLGIDGRPVAPAMAFPAAASFVMHKLIAVEGGFAALYNVPASPPDRDTYYLQVFGPNGEPRRGPVKLEMGGFGWHAESEAVGNRLIVFGVPNADTVRLRSRVLLITLNPEGGVKQEKLDFPISSASVAVSMALDEKRWAVTVRVDNGVPGEMFVFGGQAKKPVASSGGRGSKVPVRGAESLIVDGVLHPIRDEGAAGDGARPLNNPYQIAWSGGELAVTWFAGEPGSRTKPRFGRLSIDGQLHVETTDEREKTIRAAFEGRVSAELESNATILVRETPWGERVGAPTPLAEVFPYMPGGDLGMEVRWSGDRFVIAYIQPVDEKTVDDKVHLRLVAVRCDGDGKGG